MGGDTPPPIDDRFIVPGPDRESIPNPFEAFAGALRSTVLGGTSGTFAPGGPGFVPPQTFSPQSAAGVTGGNRVLNELTAAEKLAQQQAFQQSGRAQQDRVYANRAEAMPAPTEVVGGGGGISGPDLSAYRAALTEQAQQINAQIQAMYNALGEEAAANVGRIQDIYGGASTGIGDVYGSAIGNVGDAYSTAQQQAADQLARLGIEEAAPAVVNPMALSQAEAVSQLQQGLAGGQAATERFGSAASGFGSQMAQVAQQQGTEMNAAVLAALQNRLNESLLMEEQGRQAAAQASARGPAGPSFRDMLAEQQFAFDVAQAAAKPVNEYNDWKRNKFFELTTPQDGQKPLFTPEEAQAYLNALDSYMSPG
jgi:hypothetical protein